MARRRITVDVGRESVRAAREALMQGEEPSQQTLATAVRFLLEELATVAPGRTVEVRVPPFGAVQCVAGPVHARGTPPNVVELDPSTWLALATGSVSWNTATAEHRVSVSGSRASLEDVLPLL